MEKEESSKRGECESLKVKFCHFADFFARKIMQPVSVLATLKNQICELWKGLAPKQYHEKVSKIDSPPGNLSLGNVKIEIFLEEFYSSRNGEVMQFLF